MGSEMCIRDSPNDGLVGHHWEESPLGLANFICLSTGERQGQEVGAVSCEAMLGPGKHRSGCSQSAIGWITGPPMEELEKVPKELKESATL